MKVTQLGEANHLSWLADIEQVCKLKDCWDVVVAPVPATEMALLDSLEAVPARASLTATLADSAATADDKRTASAVLSALEWRRKDQIAQAILKLNLEDGKHDALKECTSAHEVYNQVQSSFTSRGMSGKIEMRRRLCSLRKKPRESMTAFINRASMLRVEMNRMGINTEEGELVAALLAGLPAAYAATPELIENHGPEDLTGVTRRLLAAELKRRRLEQEEDEAVAMAAAAASNGPKNPQPQAQGGVGQAPGVHPYEQVVPPGYAALPRHHLLQQYLTMTGHIQHGQGYTPRQPAAAFPGAGRPPRLCWGCGSPGHVQRQCQVRPYAPPPIPAGNPTPGADPRAQLPWGLPPTSPGVRFAPTLPPPAVATPYGQEVGRPSTTGEAKGPHNGLAMIAVTSNAAGPLPATAVATLAGGEAPAADEEGGSAKGGARPLGPRADGHDGRGRRDYEPRRLDHRQRRFTPHDALRVDAPEPALRGPNAHHDGWGPDRLRHPGGGRGDVPDGGRPRSPSDPQRRPRGARAGRQPRLCQGHHQEGVRGVLP